MAGSMAAAKTAAGCAILLTDTAAPFAMKAKVKTTGHAEIDRQHAILEAQTARLKSICPHNDRHSCSLCIPGEYRRCSHALITIAEGVLSLLAGHANYEEKLMGLLPRVAQCREHIRKHKTAHAEFAGSLQALLAEMNRDEPLAASRRMHQLVTQWLGEHASQFDQPLLAELADRVPTEPEFDGELVAILDHYVFHGRPTGLPSHQHDHDTWQHVETRLARLTPRQREVCALVAQGLANKVIAGKLGTTVNTIKTHRSEIYRKLQIRSLLDLVLLMDIIKK